MEKISAILIGVLLCISLAAQPRQAVVSLSANYIRTAPDYEAPLDAQALMGAVVEITGEQDYWRQIHVSEPDCTGWVTDLGLVELSAEELDSYRQAAKYICTAELTHIYRTASLKSDILGELIGGDVVCIHEYPDGRPVMSGMFAGVVLPSGEKGFVPRRDLEDLEKWSRHPQADISAITATALRFVGVPYMWGGNSPKGFDCSGLVWYCFHMNGVELPRNSSKQAACGEAVSLDALQEGDLVFFGKEIPEADRVEGGPAFRVNHVAVYLGGGKIIQASQLVRINSLVPGTLDFYDRKPLFARRITI